MDFSRIKSGENSLAHHHFHGIVIDNKDPEKQQRIKVRIPNLHKDLKDEEIPWVYPGVSNVQGNASGATGSMGPIPPIGSKVNMKYPDDTMYHGMYYGTVTTNDTKLGEFSTNSGYGADYPHVNGSIDGSGNLSANNTKKDTVENTHVSGTSHQIDGGGNVKVVVAGNAATGNPDRELKFPKGATIEISGDCTLKVKDGVVLELQKDVIIKTTGDVKVTSTEGKMYFTAKEIKFHVVEKITTNVGFQIEPGLYPAPIPNPPDAPKVRTRPTLPNVANKTDY